MYGTAYCATYVFTLVKLFVGFASEATTLAKNEEEEAGVLNSGASVVKMFTMLGNKHVSLLRYSINYDCKNL
jgi:hypothetical protein